jgi:hypothetical protein
MMNPLTQLRSASLSPCVRVLSGIVCVSLLFVSGCAERHVKARPYPWGTAASMHPLPPVTAAQDGAEGPAAQEITSPLLLQIAPPPSPLILVHGAPARPRVPAGSPAPSEATSRPDVPQIAPQLSPAETAAAQQQTNQSLSVAGRTLEAAQGKTLNGAQSDLASKIRSFIAEARDAAQNGDWTRARNAAKKAEVLSQELASSL